MRAPHIGEGVCVRERNGEKSVDRLIKSNLDGREGTGMPGTKKGRSRRLPTLTDTTHTKGSTCEVASLHSDHYPTAKKTQELSRWRGGATKIYSAARRVVRDTKDLFENR